MKLQHKQTLPLLLAAFSGIAVQAQTFVFNPSNHELLLDFRMAGKPDLIVDIGPASNYSTKNGTTIGISGDKFSYANLTVDSGFGANLSSVIWSVNGYAASGSGTVAEPASTIWATKASMTPFNRAVSSLQNVPGLNMKAVGDQGNSRAASAPVGVSYSLSSTAILLAQTEAVNYTKKIGTGNFGGNSLNAGVELTGPGDLYLHQMNPGSGAGDYLGKFTLTSGGDLSFTAVPEPSEYGMMIGGCLAVFAALRQRRNRKSSFVA